MLEKKTKIFLLIFLMLTALAILLPSGKRGIYFPKPNGKIPIRSLNVQLALLHNRQNFHEQLFEQLEEFGDTHSFTIQIAQVDPTGQRFIVQMWREDIEIIGADSLDPGLFEIGFYNTYEEQPAPIRVFDELVLDLKKLLSEIPNVTVIEKNNFLKLK